MERADRVIAMGGYNTMCEVLSLEKHALIVPRVHPNREQWIRARRMCELGLIHVLHPDLLHPDSLAEWLARDLGPPPASRSVLDFGGLERIPRLLAEVLASAPAPPSISTTSPAKQEVPR
jgi:predicted glycosyltransferase